MNNIHPHRKEQRLKSTSKQEHKHKRIQNWFLVTMCTKKYSKITKAKGMLIRKSRNDKLYKIKRGWKSLKKYLIHSLFINDFISRDNILGIIFIIFILLSSPTLYIGLIGISLMVQFAIFSLTSTSFGYP